MNYVSKHWSEHKGKIIRASIGVAVGVAALPFALKGIGLSANGPVAGGAFAAA